MAIYEYTARIRYSEIGPDSKLTLAALLDLFQNCSSFQSEDLGIGVEYHHNIDRAWVLNSWQIVINKLPTFCDEVRVQTWSCGVKMAIGYRNYRMLDMDGNTLAAANSLWAFIDTKKLVPVRCPEHEIELYQSDDPLALEPMPRKITVPDEMEILDSFVIKSYFIDTNNHVNNVKYVQVATDYIPSSFNYSTVRAEYKKSALLHDIIVPRRKIEDNCITVTLSDTNGNIYTTIQFIR